MKDSFQENIKIGQRWVSEMEPELGLGIVLQVDHRFAKIGFPASECERQYAFSSAPIKRVRFSVGDTIQSRQGHRFTIVKIDQTNGLLVYHGEDQSLPEDQLCDSLSFTSPRDRFLGGFFDANHAFNLRYHAHQFRSKYLRSRARGFIGGRIDLIPHQLYVAHKVASRHIPRVLLSDEVGLGKTIEACLILHRLLHSGRISRALILVPESLLHQWFVELLRRFNLSFRIFDLEYCQSLEESNPGANVFLEDQLVLCSIDFLASSSKLQQQAIDAKWDMLVIDEAHHLTEGTSFYDLAEALGTQTEGLLLLTATPEQLGHKSHFARLHLLDPARYYDLAKFKNEEKHYHVLAGIANKILDGKSLSKADIAIITDILPEQFKNLGKGALDVDINEQSREHLIKQMLDRHGVGRVMFRNTRAVMSNFPKRIARLLPLQASLNDVERSKFEFLHDINDKQFQQSLDFNHDPRIIWLVNFLKKKKNEKILLICRSIDKVYAIEEALKNHINTKVALFHEKLALLQRDRNAAWFAEADGAPILLCSEIGSEGRNFQFAHTLVLFDLPLNPELLQQRIGRLDRIGQTQTIRIYVPYIVDTAQEVLARWYHEGLDIFEKNVPGVYQVYQALGLEVKKLALDRDKTKITKLIEKTKKLSAQIAQKLEKGRDRLLELHSYQPQVAEDLIHDIRVFDVSRQLENFMLHIFKQFGIRYQELQARTYRVNFDLLSNLDFPIPPLRSNGLTATFDRAIALQREDIEFLSWDHPMVIGALDVLLGSEKGNSAISFWPDQNSQEFLLETIFVLESVAPKRYHADRFLPPMPIRVVVDQSLQDCSDLYPDHTFSSVEDMANKQPLNNPHLKQELFPAMINRCHELANQIGKDIVKVGLAEMKNVMGNEINRLLTLKRVNENIREDEIDSCKEELVSLEEAISSARLRLDALRFIYKGSDYE